MVWSQVWSQAFSHDLVLACSRARQVDRDLVESQQVCPLVDDHVLSLAAKPGDLAPRLRLALPPGWLSLRAEAGPRVRRVCLYLAQMVKAKDVLERPPETSSRPVVLRQVCLDLVRKAKVKRPLVVRPVVSLLRPEAHQPVCLLDRVKLATPPLRLEPLDSRQRPVAGFLLRERPRQLAEERSWGSRS